MFSSYLSYVPWSLCLVPLVYAVISARSKGKPPSGPKPLPGLGNIVRIPPGAAWEVFQHWGKKYGTNPVICQCNASVFVHDSATAYREFNLFRDVRSEDDYSEFFSRCLRIPSTITGFMHRPAKLQSDRTTDIASPWNSKTLTSGSGNSITIRYLTITVL